MLIALTLQHDGEEQVGASITLCLV